jgi:hypothetical protein
MRPAAIDEHAFRRRSMMKAVHRLAIFAAATVVPTLAFAQTPQAEHQHGASPVGPATAPSATVPPQPQQAHGMDCRCCCCEMMRRRMDDHGKRSAKPGEAPEADHSQHDGRPQ